MSKKGQPRDILTKQQRDDLILAYLSGEKYQQIADRFGVTDSAVWGIINRANVGRNRNIVRPDELQYAERFCADQREPIKYDFSYIQGRSRPNGRRAILDETVFDELTPESAYWLGLIASDGSIQTKHGRFSLILQLTEPDRYLVEGLRDFIKSNYKITDIPAGFTCYGLNQRPFHRLAIVSRRLVLALKEYGLNEFKTYYAHVLKVQYHPDFWRGVIDGDGSIKKDGINLVGSEELLNQFSEFCKTIAPRSQPRIRRRGNVFVFDLCGPNSALVCYCLYHNRKPLMTRKAERAAAIYTRFIKT